MNDALVKQEASLECQCWRNPQYSRKECTQITDMHNSIVHSDLSKMVCKVLQHIEADICEEKIDTYPRLKKKAIH